MKLTTVTLEDFQQRLRVFADERDGHQFHTPKNLAVAVPAVLELFPWLTPEQSAQITDSDTGTHVRRELADVLAYLLRLADALEVDLRPTRR